MLIGELSQKSRLSKDTIRFYEKQGLIPAGKKENVYNSYKHYPPETLQRLHMIRRIKHLGFTLQEIAAFLEMAEENSATCEQVSGKIQDKIATIDQKISELQAMKTAMTQLISCCYITGDGNCPSLFS